MKTVLYIIIFLLCLSFVVCLHELGHLLVAKACNVYCFEYSIGFGPAIFKKKFKRKKKAKKSEEDKPVFQAADDEKELGETQFAIRCIPLGGYVSMAGEDSNTDENGRMIPKERCLNGVNHFKQICIMLAGITMNFILAFVLFFASACCPKTQSVTSSNQIIVTENSKAAAAGLKTGDSLCYLYQEYTGLTGTTGSVFFPYESEDDNKSMTITSYMTFKDGKSSGTYDDLETNCISYSLVDVFSASYSDDNTQASLTLPKWFDGLSANAGSKRIIHFKTAEDTDWKTIELESVKTTENDLDVYRSFELLGITATTITVQNNFGEAVVEAGSDFSQLFVGLYSALGSIFTKNGWKQVGGIISVYKMSASGIQSGSISYFLLLWGYISLNLGCFNLLPFPGLDGWQTLIALIESIIRKKIPTKAKGIANTVGLIVMLALAGLLIVKDLITLF